MGFFRKQPQKEPPVASAPLDAEVAVAVPVEVDHTTNYVAAPDGKHIVEKSTSGAAPPVPMSMGSSPEEFDSNVREMVGTMGGERSCVHKVFLVISVATALTAVNNIVAHVIGLAVRGNLPLDVILRWYTIVFCVLVIVIEMDQTDFVKRSEVLQNWVSRGFIYTFLGILGLAQYDIGMDNYRYTRGGYRNYGNNNYYGNNRNNYNNNGYNNNNNGRIYIQIPTREDVIEFYMWMNAMLMFIMGFLYIIMGVLCLNKLLAKHQVAYQQHKQRRRQQQQFQQSTAPAMMY